MDILFFIKYFFEKFVILLRNCCLLLGYFFIEWFFK